MNPKHYLAICLALLFIPMHSHALTQITLEWQPNTEPNLADYKTFCRSAGEAYDYTEPLWEGTETSCVIEISEDDLPYHFVVRAASTDGSESLDSNEVCYGCSADEVGTPDPPDGGDTGTNVDTEDLLDGFDNETSANTGCFIRWLSQ